MQSIIAPSSVALIGASEDYAKFGGRILHHLVDHDFTGRIYPINPKRETVLGLTCYPSIEELPEPADLAVVAVPAHRLEETIEACGRAGTGACIVITAQLGEFSAEGAALEKRVVEIARGYNMRLIGPNCMGMIVPQADLALSSTPTLRYAGKLRKGGVSFVSQSGAMMGTLFLQSHDHGVGLSGMVSIGNQADVELCDFLEGFIEDPKTKVVCLYIEGLKSPERFRDLCLRAHAVGKPVLAVKAGRTEAGSTLAKSHTASLAGSYSAFETLCREAGVVLMDDPEGMILAAGVISANPLPQQAATGIICASGGGAALMADQVALRDLTAGVFSDATKARLEQDYPASHQNNPLDLGGHKGGLEFGIFERAIDAVHADETTGITAYVLTPQPLMPQTLDHLIATWQRQEKPLVVVLNTSRFGAELREQAFEAGLPFVARTDDLYRVLQTYRDLIAARAALRQAAPTRPADLPAPAITASGFLTEPEAKAILADYGVAIPSATLTGNVEEGVAAAATCGYPVVLKGVVNDVVHKSDLGLVRVGVQDEAALRAAWAEVAASIEAAAPGAPPRIDVQQMIAPGVELIVGLINEPGFGAQLVLAPAASMLNCCTMWCNAAPRSPPGRCVR